MGTCIGQSWAELEAMVTSIAAQGRRTQQKADMALRQMIDAGMIKRCSKHKDKWIAANWRAMVRSRSRHDLGE